MCAGCGKGERRVCQLVQRRLVIDARTFEHCAVSVRRIRTETGIDPQAEIVAELTTNRADRIGREPVREALLLFLSRHRE